MPTMVSGEWYKTEDWPTPSWDQGNKWDAVNQCWHLDRDGLYLFSVVAGGTLLDIAVNDWVKVYVAITTGDPDVDGVILAAGTDVCSDAFPYYEFNVHGWRPLRAPLDVFCYVGQMSSRDRDITFEPAPNDYFSYSRQGPYPT